ncbi:hypothetical protein F5148DRAFT_313208 [Russula earlei]|uniref:Uncharacterized protein n=1 Tax=Russula earlei TaxID=71964 RepID=A0ACC0U2P0_9AGAM|nr:hypothetical protein F5148DRAFT_313208 [Russula earlei]
MNNVEPEVIAAKDFMTVVKMLHFIDGVKFWYFLSNLDFDWRLVNRKPASTFPGLVYLASRFTSIACVVSFLVGLNASHQIHCQAWISTAFAFPLLELELALVLIVIRVVAIWKRSNVIILFTGITLLLHSSVSLYLLSGIRSFWDPGPDYRGCVTYAPRMHLISMSTATITVYAFLLILMFAGLVRQRPARSFGVWNMLCQQGWIWFALAVAAELPTLFLVLLNINSSLNLLLQIPRVVIASIGTTAMFRALHEYPGRREAEMFLNIMPLERDSSTRSTSSSSPLNPLKVSVHTTTIAESSIPKEDL